MAKLGGTTVLIVPMGDFLFGFCENAKIIQVNEIVA
jgi:hypothetical protein